MGLRKHLTLCFIKNRGAPSNGNNQRKCEKWDDLKTVTYENGVMKTGS